MNNSFYLQQIQKTSNLDANLITKQYKLNLMAEFMRMKYENPKLKQNQKANQLGYSTSTLQRYRNDMKFLSAYRILPNNTNKRTKKVSYTNFDNNPHPNTDDKKTQMTSNQPQTNQLKIKKNKLKGGANIEINEKYLDEIGTIIAYKWI